MQGTGRHDGLLRRYGGPQPGPYGGDPAAMNSGPPGDGNVEWASQVIRVTGSVSFPLPWLLLGSGIRRGLVISAPNGLPDSARVFTASRIPAF